MTASQCEEAHTADADDVRASEGCDPGTGAVDGEPPRDLAALAMDDPPTAGTATPTAAATPAPAPAPLMSPADRALVRNTIQDQFKVDPHFLAHFALTRARMKTRLRRARDAIAAREAANPTPASPPPPMEPPTLQERRALRRRERELKRSNSGAPLLEQRLAHLRLAQAAMAEDGNCQFRAIAHQLHGDPGGHAGVRRRVAAQLRRRAGRFVPLFDGEARWEEYVEGMERDGSWGDELTLKAASGAFGCRVHVLTSEKEHYYVCYAPDDEGGAEGAEGAEKAKGTEGTEGAEGTGGAEEAQEAEAAHGGDEGAASSTHVEDIFLAYISPVHYNSIHLAPRE